jgi:hypothetical protein
MNEAKWPVIGFWISTVLFALQMGFTAYAQMRLPQVAAAFAHLGSLHGSESNSRAPSSGAWPPAKDSQPGAGPLVPRFWGRFIFFWRRLAQTVY